VHELFDPDTGSWDELVRETFWQEDAEIILSNTVHEGMDDMIAWHYNKNGMFSVRSAYKVHVADRERCNAARSGGSSFTRNNGDQLWKQLWQVDCTKKMLHFKWRVSHNSLALHVNLKRKGIKLNTGCVLCGRLEEDGAHLFFKCKHAKRVWDDLQL
jgi:hypothetical protein